jgi:hypothetical protein
MTKISLNSKKIALPFVGLSVLIAAGAMSPTVASARKGGSAESSIKAAYVYNFAKLTTWPEDGDIVIGIIGSSDAGDTIKRIVDGKAAGSHTISVKDISAGGAKSCQMVFVCSGGGVPSVGAAHCLTVGEGDGFADNGGGIGFESTDGKVHFAINMKAVKKAGLKINDKLKAIGRVID